MLNAMQFFPTWEEHMNNPSDVLLGRYVHRMSCEEESCHGKERSILTVRQSECDVLDRIYCLATRGANLKRQLRQEVAHHLRLYHHGPCGCCPDCLHQRAHVRGRSLLHGFRQLLGPAFGSHASD